MTNLAKLRCFKELVKKLKGYYTEDADNMYYDCSGGDSSETECYIERYRGDVCATHLENGIPSYVSKEGAGSYNCSGGY